jgi:hypothetical protein
MLLRCRVFSTVPIGKNLLVTGGHKCLFTIVWSNEFEELCDVIAKEVERQLDIVHLKRRRSNPDMHFVKHPFYDYVIWALTLSSLSIAISTLNVRY